MDTYSARQILLRTISSPLVAVLRCSPAAFLLGLEQAESVEQLSMLAGASYPGPL
jgi:hypothetical protein